MLIPVIGKTWDNIIFFFFFLSVYVAMIVLAVERIGL